MDGLLLAEPFIDTDRRNFSHIRNLDQFLLLRLHQSVHAAEMRRQHLSGLGAHLTDTQSIDEPAKVPALAVFDGCKKFFCCRGPGFPQSGYFVQCQIIDIRRGADQSLFDECFHNSAAQPLNIHCIPTDEMGNIPAELGGTLCSGTP